MLDIFAYRLPFSSPFRSAKQLLKERTGWILKWRADGGVAVAEYAPLPGYGEPDTETIARFQDAAELRKLHEQMRDILSLPFSEMESALEETIRSPGLKFAISSLAIQLEARSRNVSGTELLTQTGYLPFTDSDLLHGRIRINDIWSIPAEIRSKRTDQHSDEDVETMWIHDQIRHTTASGLRDVKIKFDADLDRFKRIVHIITAWNTQLLGTDTHSAVKIKADFNHSLSWDQMRKLDQMLSDQEKETLCYIEDPVAIDSLKDLARLRQCTSLPLALDESFPQLQEKTSRDELITALLENQIHAVVIKPALLGSVFELSRLHQNLSRTSTGLVISSLLESSVGRAVQLFMCIYFGSKEHSHGLWTGSLFSEDIFEDPVENYVKISANTSFGEHAIADVALWANPEVVVLGHPLLKQVFTST